MFEFFLLKDSVFKFEVVFVKHVSYLFLELIFQSLNKISTFPVSLNESDAGASIDITRIYHSIPGAPHEIGRHKKDS